MADRPAVSAGAIALGVRAMQDLGLSVDDYYENFGIVSGRIDPARAGALLNSPYVDLIAANMPIPYFGGAGSSEAVRRALSTQQRPWGHSMLHLDEAWTVTRGAGARLLLIDYNPATHEDLPEIVGRTVNFGFGCIGAQCTHGRAVLGTVIALDNHLGTVGVAPDVASADVHTWAACGAYTGGCVPSEVVSALNWAIGKGFDVVNMSFGTTIPDWVDQFALATALATADDIVLVTAAGNEDHVNQTVYPAGFAHVLGVSGVRENGTFAGPNTCSSDAGATESNFGVWVDVAAPFITYTLGTTPTSYATFCGTSFSAPYVAGLALLLRSRHPQWYNTTVMQKIMDTAVHPQGLYHDPYFGHGIVNARDALDVLGASPVSGPTAVGPGTHSWTVTPVRGTGTYTYQWRVRWHYSAGHISAWTDLGTGQAQQLTLGQADPDLELEVVIQSGDQTTSRGLYVNGPCAAPGGVCIESHAGRAP